MSQLGFSSEFIEEKIEEKFSPIQNYLKNKNVFLTGGTGFLGILYVEKLLRSDVKTIYLLIRSKKNVNVIERIKTLFTGQVFRKLSKHDVNYLRRIRIIEGDLSQLKLGISEENLKDMYNNVDIVLHSAADVRFDEKLINLLLTNLRGTKELLKICDKIKNLELVTYISTAYSNCYRKVIHEKIYDCLADPNKLIELAEKVSADPIALNDFEIMTGRIIMPFPNTYTFSKNLSEILLKQYAEKLNICIIRPSIIISTHEDPLPGWCNNLNGLNGALFAVGMGMCRLLPHRRSGVCDIVCADFVINSTLAAMWYVNNERTNKTVETIENPQIFHVNTCMDLALKYGTVEDGLLTMATVNVPYKSLWQICCNGSTCPFMWKYLTLWYHIIPSIFFDWYFSFTNKSLRILPIYRKIQRFMESLTYFMQNEWQFTNTNMKKVWNSMTAYDQEFYPSDVRRLNWESFVYSYTLGLILYMGNESINTKEIALKRHKKLRILHLLVLCIYYGIHILMFMAIAMYFDVFGKAQNSLLDTIEFIKNPR